MKNLYSFFIESKELNLKQVQGKEPEKNGSNGVFAIDEPTDNEALEADDIDPNSEENTASLDLLIEKFQGSKPRDFFILGRAGWGKTQIIKSVAKKFKRSIITVYLDKAAKEDLGGIPVPVKDKDDDAVQKMAMPEWATIMKKNPDKKFLLFFDEMNQASPDIQNALMPIILEHEICGRKFDNFFVGAAGNFESENMAVSELSGPLKSRFKPIITWETNTTEAWKQAFKHLHKKWDNIAGKKFVDLIEDNAELFENPREIENNIIDHFYDAYINPENKENSRKPKSGVILNWLEGLCKEDLTRTEENNLKKLAENIFEFVSTSKDDKKEESSGRSGRKSKDINMVNENIKTAIKQGMKFGYIEQEGVKYGISEENIRAIVDSDDCNAEMLERIINKFEADGITFKFKKNEEWKKKGYSDPEED